MPGGPIVAGDIVELAGDLTSPRIRAVGPRRTLLARGDFGSRNRARPLVANADLLVVVASMVDPPFRSRFVDRYLAAGELGGLECAIVLTKADKLKPAQVAAITEATLQAVSRRPAPSQNRSRLFSMQALGFFG